MAGVVWVESSGRASATTLTYEYARLITSPSVSTVSPGQLDGVEGGAIVTVSGFNFGDASDACFVDLGAFRAQADSSKAWLYTRSPLAYSDIVFFSMNSIRFRMPVGTGDVDVYVRIRAAICVALLMFVRRWWWLRNLLTGSR